MAACEAADPSGELAAMPGRRTEAVGSCGKDGAGGPAATSSWTGRKDPSRMGTRGRRKAAARSRAGVSTAGQTCFGPPASLRRWPAACPSRSRAHSTGYSSWTTAWSVTSRWTSEPSATWPPTWAARARHATAQATQMTTLHDVPGLPDDALASCL